MINFAGDAAALPKQSDPTQNATLTITGVGAGTVGLDNALTVDATDATGGSATSGTDYATYGTQTLTFNTGDGASIASTNGTLDVTSDQRLEGDETVNLAIGSLSSTLDGQVSIADSTHTATITDDETGVINFAGDAAALPKQSDPTQNATLTITGVGAGTVGLDNALTVDATDATGGSATSGTDYATYGTQTLTFNTGDGASIASTNGTLDVTSDQRLEGDETVNLAIGSLSSTLDGQVSIADSTHTATITDDETGVINFAGDAAALPKQSDPTQNATLTITGVGAGTVGLDNALTVDATDATGGSATSGTDYATYGTQTLTFNTGDGASIASDQRYPRCHQ